MNFVEIWAKVKDTPLSSGTIPSGDRIPAVFQVAGSNILHIACEVNGNTNYNVDYVVKNDEWFNLKISQVRGHMNTVPEWVSQKALIEIWH